MILKHLTTALLPCLTASVLLVGPAFSQTPSADPSVPASQKSIQVQVVVVGQSVPPRYEVGKRVRIKELRGSGGDSVEKGTGQAIPEQVQDSVPLQIAPEPDELPPSPLYIKTGRSWTMIPVRENTASPKVSVPVSANVVVAEAKDVTAADGKKSQDYKPLGEFPIAENQSGMLILIVKDPRKPLKWVILRSLAIDTSWIKLPAGSFTVFNASCLPLRGHVSTNTLASVPLFEKASLTPKSDDSGQVPYYLEVQHPDGSWNIVVNTSTSLGDGGRIIAIPYGVVRPETKRYASFMIIRDFQNQGGLAVPKAPAVAQPAAVTSQP